MDNDDFFTKIRQALEREELEHAVSGEKTTIPFEHRQSSLDGHPTPFYRRVLNLSSDYAAGLILIAWTVLPLSLALMFVDSLYALLCLYPLLCPFIWVGLARWKPDKANSTVILGIVGHVLLIVSLWFILKYSGMGNNIGFDFVGILVILALLVFSTLGSIFTILITDFFRLGKNN